MKFSRIFGNWIKENIAHVIIYNIFVVIIFLMCYLYNINLEAIVDAVSICTFLGGIILLLRFFQYATTVRKLELVNHNFNVSVDALPEVHTLKDKMYQDIIRELYDNANEFYSHFKNEEEERNEYYTLWVHQIKTPIAAMHLLVQTEENQERKRKLSQELFRTEKYIEMALHFLHLQEETSDFVLKEYDLFHIVKGALKKYSVPFFEKKLTLSFETFTFRFVTDDKWLSFVIEQIISNCIKYTCTGGLRIQFVEEIDKAVLSISDTGIGIREEDLPRIFEKGFTGYNGHMDKKSTGIGLYLCKKVTDKLGIKIEVSSRLEEGTIFYLTIMKD